MLDRTTDLVSKTRITGFDHNGAPAGGLVNVHLDLDEAVVHSELLVEVTDVFGEVKAMVTADSDGVFWRTYRLSQVATDEHDCTVGIDVDSY